jgi:SAM-dependent methyltransferase
VKRSEKELFYDSISGDWESFMNDYDLGRRLDVVFNELLAPESLRGLRLLDAGCGTGWFTKRAIDRGASVTSLDLGLRLATLVRNRFHSSAACGDVLALPFPDGSFDVVVSSEVVEHTPDPARAVSEMARVLRPGGVLALTCPNRFWYWSCWLANRTGIRPYKGLENWPSWAGLRRSIEGSSLRVLEMRGVHLFPFVVRVFRPLLRRLDRFGKLLGPAYVNIAVKAEKPVL